MVKSETTVTETTSCPKGAILDAWANPEWNDGVQIDQIEELTTLAVQTLDDFAGLRIQHRNLLEARMEITSYNQHTRLLSSESWSQCTAKFTRPGEEPTLLSNH